MIRYCIISLIIFIFSNPGNLTAQCDYPVDQARVEQLRNDIKHLRNPEMKLQRAKGFTRSNCLLSVHVKDIASEFFSDASRLEFAKFAYSLVNDQNNYLLVMDVFDNMSAAFKLYDHINFGTEVINEPDPVIVEPTYFFPTCEAYSGNVGCGQPLSLIEFNGKRMHVGTLSGTPTRLNALMNISSSSCLSTEQAMRFCLLLDMERARLDYLKYAIPYIFDIDNYHESAQLLSLPEYKQELLTLLGQSSPPVEEVPSCAVAEEEFPAMLSSIDKQDFKSTKITVAKQIIKERCMTCTQIKDVLILFTFESSKLEIAKFSYDFVFDPHNYYLINDVFSYESSISDLDNYINSKK